MDKRIIMKKIFSFLFVLAALAALPGIESCQSTSKSTTSKVLKFNLQKGKGYDYAMQWDMNTKVKGQESTVAIDALYSMNVTDDNGSVKSITTSYKRLHMNMKVMGMTIDIDSEKPFEGNGESDITNNPLGLMNKMISGMVGKSFVVKVNESGEVLEVSGFNKIIDDMIDSMGMGDAVKAQAMGSMKDQFNDESLKDQFAQIFTIFPNKEIKVGDTWQKKYSTGGKMASSYTTDYTVKEIDGDHVTLTTKTKIGSDGSGKEIDGSQTGNIIVDSQTGLMVNAKFDQQFDVKAQGETISVTGSGKITGKAN